MSLIKILVIAPITFVIILSDSLISNAVLGQNAVNSIASTNSTAIIAQTQNDSPDRNPNSRPERERDRERIITVPRLRQGVDLLMQLINSNQSRPDARQVFEEEFKRADINQAVQLFEEYQGRRFNNHLELDAAIIPPTITEISQTLSNIHQNTGKKPALSYVVSLKDELHIILILPNSPTISSLKNQEKSVISQNAANNTERIILRASRKDLEKAAEQFRNEVIKPTRSKIDLNHAQTLYHTLIAPLEANLQANKIDTLIISADSGLRSIPVAALYDGQQYLIEKYSLSIIPTFRLANLRSLNNIKDAKLLAMGISKPKDGQIALPAARVEVDTLGGQLWQGTRFLDEETTVDNLKSINRQQSFGILHFATHADFQKGKAKNSYIQFWDRKVNLKQLRSLSKELEWHNIDMLVLSACRTALGNEEAELGFAGLAVGAGVKTAVGSLWKVNDEATLGLMSEFYSRLKSAPSKAEALRQAQIAMLKGQVRSEGGQLILASQTAIPLPAEILAEGEDFTHPYFWSAFTVIGNWN